MLKNLTEHKDFLSIIIIFFLAFIFFSKAFLQGQIIWGFDTPKIIFPFIFLLDESFKHFQLPLWTPDIYFGFPVGADGQIPWFYPLNILHVFLPLYLVVSILSFLHVFLAGMFTYFFARTINLGRFASVFAGIAFMFNGFIIVHMQYFSHIYAYAYLPLILLFVELAISKRDNLYFILAGGSFGLQLLSGHPNIPIMTITYVILYMFLRFKVERSQFFMGIVITVGTALVVAFPYVLYSLRLIPLSIRGQGVDFADATNSSFSFFDLVTFIFPNFFFDKINDFWVFTNTWHFWSYWGQIETTGYIGIMTLFLAPFAFLKATRKKAILFFILLLISLIFALGKNTPLYRIVFNTPILDGLRSPGRALLLVDFSLAILAGLGITALFQADNVKRIKINLAIISASCSIFAFVIIGSFLTRFYPGQIYNFILQNYSKLGYVANLDNPVAMQQIVLVSFQEQTRTGLIFIVISTLIILLIWNGFKNYLAKFLILTLVIADLLLFSGKVNIWKSFDELTKSRDPVFTKLENELSYDTGRIYTFANFWSDLMPNQLMPRGIPEANGFASLPLKRFERWQKIAEERWSSNNSLLFQLGSIKYIYSLKDGTPVLNVIENSLPRVYITNKWVLAKNDSETFDLLTAANFDPDTVILETSDLKDLSGVNTPMVTPAVITSYKPNYVKIQSDVPHEGILVLTDTNYPGWEAYLNNKNVPIYQANYLFRGIKVPAGVNIIEFKYEPKYLNRSLIVSLGTTLFILALFSHRLLKGRMSW